MGTLTFATNVGDEMREIVKWVETLVPLDPDIDVHFKVGDLNHNDPQPGIGGATSGVINDAEHRTVTIDMRAMAFFDAGMPGVPKDNIPKLSPVAQHTPILKETILHEWMHVNDRRSLSFLEELMPMPPSYPKRLGKNGLSGYAYYGGEREAYADAGVEYFGSFGKTVNAVALWYAKTGNWEVGKPLLNHSWDMSHSIEWMGVS